jgi:hypothetical protein
MESKLRKYCLYAGDDWVDVIRIHPVPCDGMIRYVVRHTEEEDMWIFDSIQEALEFIATEYIDSKPSRLHIGECP